eukprot:7916016-Pyramimonas_sp.AAC.1
MVGTMGTMGRAGPWRDKGGDNGDSETLRYSGDSGGDRTVVRTVGTVRQWWGHWWGQWGWWWEY